MNILLRRSALESVSDYLNRKYEEQRVTAKRDGRRYSMTQFAADVGVTQATMSRLMKLGPETSPVEAIDSSVLMALYDRFGAEFMEAMRGDAKLASARKQAKRVGNL